MNAILDNFHRLQAQRQIYGLWRGIDWTLLLLIGALISIGIVFSYSSSIAVAETNLGDNFYYARRHLVYLLIGGFGAFVVLQIPINVLYQLSSHLLFLAMVLLILVLIPSIGVSVNGSRRWLSFGILNFQVSEFAKLAMILFISGYVIRRQDELRVQWSGFSKPLIILALVLILLLLEPDFGSAVVVTVTVLGILFLAGIQVARFTLCLVVAVLTLGYLATTNQYRLDRLTAFMDPWADQFNTGYQLTQALIAFGRGEWFGVGLGNSLQKLFYLPEAHTDFVFAVIAEELGLVGVVLIIGLLWAVAAKIMQIGRRAHVLGKAYAGYVCFGIAIMFSVQSFINIGVASGLLPTKGLTLPFISCGGSSLLIWMASIAVVLRTSREINIEHDAKEWQ